MDSVGLRTKTADRAEPSRAESYGRPGGDVPGRVQQSHCDFVFPQYYNSSIINNFRSIVLKLSFLIGETYVKIKIKRELQCETVYLLTSNYSCKLAKYSDLQF